MARGFIELLATLAKSAVPRPLFVLIPSSGAHDVPITLRSSTVASCA